MSEREVRHYRAAAATVKRRAPIKGRIGCEGAGSGLHVELQLGAEVAQAAEEVIPIAEACSVTIRSHQQTIKQAHPLGAKVKTE